MRTGTVHLDLRVPGRRAAVIEALGHGELVGWSWHFPPYLWQLGAEATTPVRAWEFDAEAMREMCVRDPEFGRAVAVWVGRVVAHRLHAARVRLLDMYAPYALTACLLFAAWPFTRLVHVWSAPIGYLVRPCLVYRRRSVPPPGEPSRRSRPARHGGRPR